ncbi:MAG: protein-L-isoaspartate(D-aspartate) O-methyltransferase [Gemmatimonadales bacterium]|nr:protein-L-isoaspartate(D-aspartate) O-methyltransferase [Gemmatimonadales bacterium]MDZ4388200.1 protein-L-isoaspartate(D-aspartate) O-methyltransferase [Gemmatimonadales bacterium]
MSDGYAGYRSQLVEALQLKGIRDMAVLRAVGSVPRHRFVPGTLERQAYEDVALPIGAGQTISQPYVQARSCELLALTGRERVLEIGTGSGYQTALLAMLAESVFSIERIPELARRAHEILRELGFANVTVMHADGTLGWKPNAPYHGIVVAAASPDIPLPLVQQLTPGGRLVIPVGSRESQVLTLVTRHPEGAGYDTRPISDVRFVPLLGEFGFALPES